jgi:hypothetical protein
MRRRHITEGANRPSIVDDEHPNLLSIGCMIPAGFRVFFGLFGFFYVFMGMMMGELFRHAHEFNAQPN